MRYLKKVFSLFASAIVVLILSGFLSLRPITLFPVKVEAHHTDLPTGCYGVTMVPNGRLLTDPSEPDAGQLNFYTYGHDYASCVESKNQSNNFFHGWVWNTNLGDISLACKNGDNLGIPCGSVDYGVVANPGARDGRVRGFAWGDNIGWISMGCDAGSNTGVACGPQDYGVQIAQADGENGVTCKDPNTGAGAPIKKDDLYGYAWTDSVGWINFCGAHAYVFDPPPTIVTAKLEYENIEIPPGEPGGGEPGGGEPGGGEPTPSSSDTTFQVSASGAEVYANGESFYKIFIALYKDDVIAKGEATPPNGAKISSVVWDAKVNADQIARTGNGAILPGPSEFQWSSGDGAFVGKLRAVAPTNDSNYIKLMSASVDVGNGAVDFLDAKGRAFEFAPAIAVTQIQSDTAQGSLEDSLLAIIGTPTNHTITVTGSSKYGLIQSGSARIYTQLHDCEDPDTADYFDFAFDTSQSSGATSGDSIDPAGSGSVCSVKQKDPTLVTLSDIDKGSDEAPGILAKDIDAVTHKFTRTVVATQKNIAAKTTVSKAFGMLTRVVYTASVNGSAVNVRYISHIAKDGSLLNQAADVRGNVRIDVQKVTIQGSVARTVGETAQSKREPFYRAIKRLARPVVLNSRTFTNSSLAASSVELYYFKRDPNALPNTPCQVIFSDTADISINKHITFITEGCDVFIDKNIDNSTTQKQLGIITLEDISLGPDTPRRGGNVYVCASVTDLYGVHFVADGGVLSYDCRGDKSAALDSEGFPLFPTGARSTLQNQLTITGEIISNNTYGGSLLPIPILGDGTPVLDPNQSYKARIYDINFLRYANTTVDINSNECWAGALSKTFVASPTCTNDNSLNSSIVNIRYQAASNDLPVFNVVK